MAVSLSTYLFGVQNTDNSLQSTEIPNSELFINILFLRACFYNIICLIVQRFPLIFSEVNSTLLSKFRKWHTEMNVLIEQINHRIINFNSLSSRVQFKLRTVE